MPNILRETARGIDIILLDDELFSNREIFFTDEVNTSSATLLLKQLMYLDRNGTGEEITLYINSLGGDVISGLAVYDFIRLMKSPVRTVCTGTAASMGAILFLAGEKRVMLPHTRLARMILVDRSHTKFSSSWTSLTKSAKPLLKSLLKRQASGLKRFTKSLQPTPVSVRKKRLRSDLQQKF